MNNAHARYGAYKNSGVEWLGEVPARWEVTRNKDIFEERGDLSVSGGETLLTVSHITGVTRRSEKNVNMFMAETMEGYKLCKAGDLVVNTMWAWMGALGTAKEAGICSPAYGVYKPNRHVYYDYRYFDYLYRTPNAITEMTRNSKGIVSSRLRLYPKDFFQIQTALPDENEQTAIANYLDSQTAQIDRKINLLSQKATQYGKLRQSLINKIVTRGLDKAVLLKDSGVEWLGEVPAHWEIKRLKDFIRYTIGGEVIDVSYWNEGTELTYTAGKYPVNSNFEHFPDRKRTKSNDILIARNGDGFIHIPKPNSIFTNVVQLVRLCKFVDVRFIYYSLENIKFLINKTSNGDFIASLNKEMWFNSFLVIPKMAEQQVIANYLDEKNCTHRSHHRHAQLSDR
jgi:type I restriction enzyme, S subunit